jgi:hypothetical protein
MGRLHKVRCPTCNGQKRLWLGAADYVDCPDCEALGWVEYHRLDAGPLGIVYTRDLPKPPPVPLQPKLAAV